MARVLAVIEDPGAANGMVGLEAALAKLDIRLEIYATGAATAYAPAIGLKIRDIADFPAVIPGDCALLAGTSENPDSIAFALIRSAIEAGVASFGFVDGPANASMRFKGRSGSPLTHAPEILLVSDALAEQAFVALGFPASNIVTVGHPNLDRVRQRKAVMDGEGQARIRRRLFPEIPANSKLVLFAAETSDGLNPAEFRRSSAYTLNGGGLRDGRTEICFEEVVLALALMAEPPSLVLRLHPKNTRRPFDPYKPRIAAFSEGGDPLEAVYASDLVIGMTSVLLFEATVMGKPTLSLTPRASEAAWLSSIGLGLTRHVCTRADFRDTLRAMLAVDSTPNMTAIDDKVPPGAATRMAAAIAARLQEAKS